MSHILRKKSDSKLISVEREKLPDYLAPRAWKNTSTCIHYFESYLEKVDLKRHFEYIAHFPKIILVKPGQTQVLPHGCFTVHTRDGGPVTGQWCKGEVIEGGLRTDGYGS